MLTSAAARRLDNLGLVVYDRDGTTAFLEALPAQPDEAVGIFAQPGTAPGRFRRSGLQVIVRGDGERGRARTGFELAASILDALDGEAHVVWGEGTADAVRVAWCRATQAQPTSLGDDDNGQPRWSVRFDVELAGEVAR